MKRCLPLQKRKCQCYNTLGNNYLHCPNLFHLWLSQASASVPKLSLELSLIFEPELFSELLSFWIFNSVQFNQFSAQGAKPRLVLNVS
jgi:hypothetical protein